jgi:hypothetical protein
LAALFRANPFVATPARVIDMREHERRELEHLGFMLHYTLIPSVRAHSSPLGHVRVAPRDKGARENGKRGMGVEKEGKAEEEEERGGLLSPATEML